MIGTKDLLYVIWFVEITENNTDKGKKLIKTIGASILKLTVAI